MKIFLKSAVLIFLIQIISNTAMCQATCDISSLSPGEKTNLATFWNNFQKVLKEKDTSGMAKLCVFPLRTNYMSSIKSAGMFKKIAKLFFKDELVNKVTTGKVENSLRFHGNYGEIHKTCVYDFYFITGQREIHFDLTNIGGQYKLTSSWR